ncbi:hypothetical protein E3N88_29359 [Mikania micrantha]|uniref:AAA+ ATPase domain-containing protein n=1 Tax=Mikania micrantha TaxID=192012 RepID=A0A5N6MJ80_9ASTR|nr:hypothetical protein E3N88_29349 [Mikania micrantha]KAD3640136.1 hypothetical protein E3N88_29359 [Mikania micrantha]
MADCCGAGVVVEKLLDILISIAKENISYMWNCSKNVQTCKDEVEKLDVMMQTLQDRINDATSKAEVPGKDMQKWMKDADKRILEAREFNEEAESKTTSCNLCTLYRYGKKATEIKSSLLTHQKDGEPFRKCDFCPLPTPVLTDTYKRVNLENIDSHKSTLSEIVLAIKNEDVQIIGIVGQGGAGKTTLAKEAASEMNDKFDHIQLVEVSVDKKKEIRRKLETAAKKVSYKEKVLIILDDVWEEFKLGDVGIPCVSEYKNCKILITSRNEDKCRVMNAQKIFTVMHLPEEEAWTLFKRVVNRSQWDERLERIGRKSVKECGGLPLFIQVLGMALKDKEFRDWETMLDLLQAPTVDEFTKEFRLIKKSYDQLENDVTKKCFLLCSMFPEDETIGLKRLTHYGLALGIFNNVDSIKAAISKVRYAVRSLISSFLLQPTERFNIYIVSREGEEEEFKMHDIVRKMALIITSEGNDSWVRTGQRLTDWNPNDCFDYKKISLIGNIIKELPDHDLQFSHLDTFLVQDNYLSSVPDEFFQGMEKLKVLDMSYNNVSSLPRSLKLLKVLHTLYLSENGSISEISILGELTLLKILKLRATGITNIPEEIGKLTKLRLLDVDYCAYLSCVTPGVISKLIWLEEFYIGMGEGNCDFVGELSKLKWLKVLHLKVPSLSNFPQDFRFEALMEFHIKDNVVFLTQTRDCKRILEISESTISVTKQIMELIKASEMLVLWKIKYFDDILLYLYEENLRYITLHECENVKSLVKTTDNDGHGQWITNVNLSSQLEEILLTELGHLQLLWDKPYQNISLCNLTTITISKCPSLLKLFPLSVAQGLVKLRDLEIHYCESLVAVISAGDEETTGMSDIELVDNDIKFPELSTVSLWGLPKLESFYSGHSKINYPSLKSVKLVGCPGMKTWSNGENHTPNIKFEDEETHSNINDYIKVLVEKNGDPNDWCSDDDDEEGIETQLAVAFLQLWYFGDL